MRLFLKRIANATATLIVLPAYGLYLCFALVSGGVGGFQGWSQLFSMAPGLCGVYLRRAFYGLVLPRCDEDVCISFGTTFSHPTAGLGRAVYVGVGCMIGDATLEDDVLISSHVSIINGGRQHGTARLDIPVREQPGEYPRITIGRDSWVGDRAVILADIGKHCVVGAGSVVTRPIPDYAIAVGAPARVIGDRREVAAAAGSGSGVDGDGKETGRPELQQQDKS